MKKFILMVSVIFLGGCNIFNPKEQIPEVTTTSVTNLTQTTATCGGNISSDGKSTVTARGVCWNTTGTPTTSDNKTIDSSGTGSFTSTLSALSPSTTYYVRAYATNSTGTGYGMTISFKTEQKTIITDIDGNVYHTVKIGNQVWTIENLRTTRLNDGTPIPYVTDKAVWEKGLSAYCDYDFNPSNAIIYGKMYSSSALYNIAPKGWHVPIHEDWDTLINFLGGYSLAGEKMKETGTIHWMSPNSGATNESGFSALPGGGYNINNDSTFTGIGQKCYLWNTSPGMPHLWGAIILNFTDGKINTLSGFYGNRRGFYVRLIKD